MENLEQIIKQYVLGQLDEQDAEAFEEYFLARPEIAEQIEAVQQLHLGLGVVESELSDSDDYQLTNESAVGKADFEVPAHTLSAMFSRYMVGPAQSMTMAAMLLILAPLALTSMQHSADPVSAQLIRLDSATVRSSVPQSSISLPSDGGYAAVMVRVRDVEFPEYRLQVQGATEWRSEPFEFSSGSRDHLVLIPPSIAAGNVKVTLLATTVDGQERAVPFCNYTEACM
ncbi:hypothetical protein [Arenicella xantha]|nr:hypothetical protein [Arenicella xantha]